MARGRYVYIVIDDAAIVRLFTVKREMVHWLRSLPKGVCNTYECFRFEDGAYQDPTRAQIGWAVDYQRSPP